MRNIYIIEDDKCIIRINHKRYGYKDFIIDLDDVDKVSKYKWNYNKNYYTFYSQTTLKNGKAIMLHRLIMSPEKGMLIDHINHDGTDNRKCNLRIVTHKENNKNRRKIDKGYNWNKLIKYINGITNEKEKVKHCINEAILLMIL